jgi:hypothetical protein
VAGGFVDILLAARLLHFVLHELDPHLRHNLANFEVSSP